MRLYTTADCTGAVAAHGTAAAFASPGLRVGVPSNSTTSFRATATDSAGNVSPCSAALTYVEDSTAPGAPAITSSDPASPANNNEPEDQGHRRGGSTVQLYTTADCTGAAAATAAPPRSPAPGLTVTVADNSTTSFRATATDAAGNTSPCSAVLQLRRGLLRPAARRALTDSDPDSPANDNAPRIKGTAADGSTVRLYTTADCTGAPAATGTAAALDGPGLTVSVARQLEHRASEPPRPTPRATPPRARLPTHLCRGLRAA